ncbi:MAG: hypothetical protein Tp1102DCM295711_20 [Prokaryotic dsDNA virus sp.]|nr:MAG: hypothetical protein Tp1102DCM295711_20 [Prokaryotic dsDNA virus sp.]|tara:strand:+ start:16954 stop:17823 length:870 start_codon:yes stop_codon:yes gene_type:complete
MAKRFVDTKIWDKAWFRKLSSKNKLFWIYLLTKCDHAGIWDADWEAVEFFIGEWVEFEELPNEVTSKMQYIKESGQYFIPAFIEFQYGSLRENSKPHLSVIKRLTEKGLLNPIQSVSNTLKDKEKAKVKVKDKKKRGEEWSLKVVKIAKELKLDGKITIAFVNYWTESNENGRKMRYEMQKTFDIKRRLIKWRDNNTEWTNNNINTRKSFESSFTKLKSGIGYKAWCSKCGKKEMPADFFAIKKGSSCCAVDYLSKEPEKKNDDLIDFNSFKEKNPGARGLNHLSKYIK